MEGLRREHRQQRPGPADNVPPPHARECGHRSGPESRRCVRYLARPVRLLPQRDRQHDLHEQRCRARSACAGPPDREQDAVARLHRPRPLPRRLRSTVRAGTAVGPRGSRRLPSQGGAGDRELARLQGGRTDRNHVRPGAAKRTQRRLQWLLRHVPVSESARRHYRHDRGNGRNHDDGRNGHDGTTGTTGATGVTTATPAGGGRVGLLLISKYVKPGSINVTGEYNHFALLASIEDLFGQSHLGYAAAGTAHVRQERLQRLQVAPAPAGPGGAHRQGSQPVWCFGWRSPAPGAGPCCRWDHRRSGASGSALQQINVGLGAAPRPRLACARDGRRRARHRPRRAGRRTAPSQAQSFQDPRTSARKRRSRR